MLTATRMRTFVVLVLTWLSLVSLAAQDADESRIALVLVPGEAVSTTLERVVRESVALQLERYSFDVEQQSLADLPEDDERRFRFAERNNYDFALVVELRIEDEYLLYRFSFLEIAERREISRAEGRVAIGFTLDRTLQTVAYEILERGIAALVRPVEFAQAEEEVSQTGASVSAGRPSGLRALASTAIFLTTGDTADYIDPLPGTQLFVGWSTPAAPFAIGLGTGLYRGRASGDAVDGNVVLLPFHLEYRYTFGKQRVTYVTHAAIGGTLLGVMTRTRGERWEVDPSMELGAEARLSLRSGAAILGGVTQVFVFEDSVTITGIRASVGMEFGL